MKRFFMSLLVMSVVLPSFADGYQVNVLSTKQTGMGHVGTGMKLGAESMHFNPAGLVFMRNHVDMSVGISAISAKIKYTGESSCFKTDNPLSTPIYAYVGYRIYDRLAAGFSLTTPYGNALKWPKNWSGSHLIQDISLKSFVLQPTVSFKVTDRLSVGAGLMMAIGNVELSRSIMSAGDFQQIGGMIAQMPLPPQYEALKGQVVSTIRNSKYPPAAASLDGKANVRMGFNLGVLYDISEKVTVGLSYRSKIRMKVKEGEASLEYANRQIEELMGTLGNIEVGGKKPFAVPAYDQGTFRAELPLPSNITVGVSYRPSRRWEVAADLQFVGWHAYDSLNVYFNQAELGIAPIKARKDYRNSFIARVGAQYAMTDRSWLRMGVYFDESPIRSSNYNPETPGMDKLGCSTGLSFEPYRNLHIDLALLYIAGFSRDGSYTQNNVVTGKPETFTGHYEFKAVTASFGLTYTF